MQGADGRPQEFPALLDDITTAAGEHGPLSVILVMRDDFYHRLAALVPKLPAAATPGLLNVTGELTTEDLHDIIVEPARVVGLHFQPGLPEQIVSDVLASSPDRKETLRAPVTVLPLLELTLDQLWRRRKDGFLTHEAYRRIGGVLPMGRGACRAGICRCGRLRRNGGRRSARRRGDDRCGRCRPAASDRVAEPQVVQS
ncbi:hypothetical protein OG295_39380 (plasmid) [Streptomyces sp. NBC_01276]